MSLRWFKSPGFGVDGKGMADLPQFVLLVMGALAFLGVVEILRSVAVLIREETAIHDLLVNSARTKLEYIEDRDEGAGPGEFDIVGD